MAVLIYTRIRITTLLNSVFLAMKYKFVLTGGHLHYMNLQRRSDHVCFALPLLLSLEGIKLGSIHSTKLFLIY